MAARSCPPPRSLYLFTSYVSFNKCVCLHFSGSFVSFACGIVLPSFCIRMIWVNIFQMNAMIGHCHLQNYVLLSKWLLTFIRHSNVGKKQIELFTGFCVCFLEILCTHVKIFICRCGCLVFFFSTFVLKIQPIESNQFESITPRATNIQTLRK